jgi:23S rRNA pseudouridine1911/1915/1917 synthase
MALNAQPNPLFEDTHLLVLSKPAGLLSQGESSGEPNLVDWCRQHFGRNYVGLVHRLDRNTSGLMVVAKRTKAADRLTQALRSGTLVRTYQALLHGDLPRESEWVHFLRKNESTNTSSIVSPGVNGAKEARLRVKPLEHYRSARGDAFTRAGFTLETGRSHQIRVQASGMGFPLVGDTKYGAPESGFLRPALHSSFLAFPHPMTQERMEFNDELPSDIASFLLKLKEG